MAADGTKQGADATQQYEQLALALREIGAGWVAEEVIELVSRGKTVPLSSLSDEAEAVYRDRLSVESKKGLAVGRISKSDEVTIPYSPAERLALLVDATERVVTATARSHAYVTRFAAENELTGVRFEEPRGLDQTPSDPELQEIPLLAPDDLEERLRGLTTLLTTRVLAE